MTKQEIIHKKTGFCDENGVYGVYILLEMMYIYTGTATEQ